MGHEHHHHQNSGNIGFAFTLNLLFTIIEIFGGFFTNSTAILADAIHDLGDSFSLGLSWYLEKVSHKKPDNVFSYGYRRFSLLGAFISSVVLVVGAIFLLKETIPRLLNPTAPNAKGMLYFAILGIAVNGIAALKLAKSEGLHSKIVSFHLLEDVLGWAGIFFVSIILLFKNWYILDPLLSIAITIFVLLNVVKQLKKLSIVFLQGIPDNIDVPQLLKEMETVEGVTSCHHSHIWSIDGEQHSLTTHIVVAADYSKENIIKAKDAIKALLRNYHIYYYTLEIEYEDEDCSASFSMHTDT